MPKFKIGSISGSTNVIGDNNTIKNNKTMSREDFFRDEAARFIDYNVESNSFIADGHKRFVERLRISLLDYYSIEDKMLFLDFTKSKLHEYIEQLQQEDPTADIDILEKMEFFLNQEVNVLPRIVKENPKSNKDRTTVFICYSRADKKYLDDLKRHFKPFEERVVFWEDSQIDTGKKWEDEIMKAIETAKVGILLISADFFNSEFVQTKEVPRLLNKAENDGLIIINLFVKPSAHEEFPQIMQYQGINDPAKTVISLDDNAREELWVELVRQVKKLTT